MMRANNPLQLLSLSLWMMIISCCYPSNAANLPSPVMIGYWGQDLARSQYWDTNKQEPSLRTLCATRHYNIYHIRGVFSYASVNGLPGIDFSVHCSFPTDVFAGWPTTSANGFSLLNCPVIGQDIQYCQSLGKKIILTIDPTDLLSDDPYAPNFSITVAKNIWSLFLGGASTTRPFGPNVVLDGIDLHIWNNQLTGVNDLAAELKFLMGDQYLFGVTTRCLFPDYIFNPTTWNNPGMFDYVTTYFIQSTNICGYSGNNPNGFWSSISQWSNWTSQFSSQATINAQRQTAVMAGSTPDTNTTTGTPTTTVPMPLILGLVAWPTPAFAQAAEGDYIAGPAYMTDNVIPRIRQIAPNFVGIALQDTSYDALSSPCYTNGQSSSIAKGTGPNGARVYSDVAWSQLTGDFVGVDTPNALVCAAPPTTPTAVTKSTNLSRLGGATTSAGGGSATSSASRTMGPVGGPLGSSATSRYSVCWYGTLAVGVAVTLLVMGIV